MEKETTWSKAYSDGDNDFLRLTERFALNERPVYRVEFPDTVCELTSEQAWALLTLLREAFRAW